MAGEEVSGGDGWFAYARNGADDYEDPPVRDVHLKVHEHGGPFWYSEGCLGDDFDQLHEEIGITRDLYDDVMAWHTVALASAESQETFRVHQQLLRRLAVEVGPDITVPPARLTPPTAHSLLADDVESLPIATDLKREVTAWKAQAVEYAHATAANDAEIFAWEDAGTVLAGRVGVALGDGYAVTAT